MAKKIQMTKWFTIAGLLIGIIGIITPILWDLWRGGASVELKQLEEVVIIQKQDYLKKLKILYDNTELKNLTRFRFILSNTGTKPIVEDDLIEPPMIAFKSGTKILDTEIDAIYPRNLDATVTRVDQDSSVQLEFPLLNPGDNITFSILIADYSGAPFDASARIVGVEELSMVRMVSEPERTEKPTHWSAYLVGILSFIFLVAALGLISVCRSEFSFKRTLEEGHSIIPQDANKEHLLNLVRSELSWTTPSERKPVLQYIENISNENITADDRHSIEELVKTVTQRATSNVTWAFVFAIFAAIGIAYVVYQVF